MPLYRIFIWLCLLLPCYTFSQNKILFDTIQEDYKKSIESLYTKRVLEQKKVFSNQLTERKVRSDVEKTYTELSTEIIESIKKGIFVDEKNFREKVNTLFEKIQKNNPKYSQLAETEILFSFGVAPNAYAIGNDIIVLNIPLLQRLENEMQLAYIICHEIAHNLMHHSYSSIVDYAKLKNSEELKKQTREIEKQKYNKGQIASGLYKDIVYGKRKNNRKYEHQADSLGYILFNNTFPNYAYESVKTLELLETIDTETDSLTLKDYIFLFDTEKSPFRESWINSTELDKYNYQNDSKFWVVDSLKTHPDCAIRIQFLKEHFAVESDKQWEGESDFLHLKSSAKYNAVLGMYFIEEYGKSLYQTLLLYKNDPEDEFLKKLIKANLLKLQVAQNSYTLNKHLDIINPKFSNSYNTFLYFFRQLRKSQLTAIIDKYES